jgi:hypothetical protein
LIPDMRRNSSLTASCHDMVAEVRRVRIKTPSVSVLFTGSQAFQRLVVSMGGLFNHLPPAIYFFFSSFLIFLSAFFSFGVFAGSFLVAFLVS